LADDHPLFDTTVIRPFHFGAPVDHILVSRNIEVKHFEVGPDIGSDHLPLIADLRLP
jgi:hypothetical protein